MKQIKLSAFKVNELFGEFSYEIPLNSENRVTAVIAPNGSGKTLCLRMISALFQKNWSTFLDIRFKTAHYVFDDKNIIEIKRFDQDSTSGRQPPARSISITLKNQNGRKLREWTPKVSIKDHHRNMEIYLPFLTRISPQHYRHDQSGELLTIEGTIEKYSDRLPEHVRKDFYGDIPKEILNYIDSIKCRLIETQRLLVIKEEFEERYYRHSTESRSTLAIKEKSNSLKKIINKYIGNYAALSQSLDRSFPRRVIIESSGGNSGDLIPRLNNLDEKRRALMAAGILNNDVDDPVAIPGNNIEPAVARVLEMYVADTQKKLESLDPLLLKINLFKKLIPHRLTSKTVSIDAEHGLFVRSQHGEIPLDKLSSGEQHQLVLFFELLFETEANSLILIDEPELSLHVSWQKKFISDLKSIIDLNSFDVVLATHSPQLISLWDDLVVELGDVYSPHNEDCDYEVEP